MNKRKALRIAAWASIAFIVVATVSPIGWRPHDILPVNIDRALAFTLTAALFVMSYPKHAVLCGAVIVVGAGAMELLQVLSPSRHAHLDDALVKASGACLGWLLGWAVNRARSALYPSAGATLAS